MITEIGRTHPPSPITTSYRSVTLCVDHGELPRAPRHFNGILLQVAAATRPAASRRAHLHILGGGGILRRIEAGGVRAHLRRAAASPSVHAPHIGYRITLYIRYSFGVRSPVSATASCLLGVAHKPTAHPAIFAPPVAWHCLEPTKWTIPVLPPWHAPSPRSSWSLLLVVFGRLGDVGGA